ncbi:ATP-binding protein [Micromonospora zhanjiangensis]
MRTRVARLTGRALELRLLDEALAESQAGRGSAIFITGEDGIGRSRLALEAEQRAAAAGIRVLRGRGSSVGPVTPLRPLTEALLSLLRGADPPDVAGLGPYLPVLGRLVPDWISRGPEPDGESMIILAEAVLRLTAVAGRDRGCLLVLDDLQDADPQTLAVVEYLADNLGEQPTVLLATVRDEPGPALDLAHTATRRPGRTLITLDRLTRDDVRRLAGALLGGGPELVTEPLLERLWTDSAGNPFVVEEVLRSVQTTGQLVVTGDACRLAGPVRRTVPPRVARGVVRRVDRLGPQGRHLLTVAAVLGSRFPVQVVRAVAGVDEERMHRHLRTAMEFRLVAADPTDPDWYVFTQPYATDALLGQLLPAARVELARRAADETETRHPGLPGLWCELVAGLRLDAGDEPAAGRLLAEAGRRALVGGDTGDAIGLLDRARQLLRDDPDPAVQLRVVDALLQALTGAGLLDRAFAVADAMAGREWAPKDRAGLHVRLAWTALVAGRYADGLAEVAAARAALGTGATATELAAVDAVEAQLTLESPGADPFGAAEALARRSLRAIDADPAGPATPTGAAAEVACQAWHALATAVQRRDPDEATVCLHRLRRLAADARLPRWGLYARVLLAADTALRDGDPGPLRRVRDEVARTGTVAAQHHTDAVLALHEVLAGRYPSGVVDLTDRLRRADQLRLGHAARELLVARAVLAAHRGRSRELDEVLRELRWRGDGGRHGPVVHGLAGVFGALLQEDRARARAELRRARAAGDDPLGGWQGIALLLDALDRVDDPAGPAPGAGRTRWNRCFGQLAEAVRHGRDGRPDRAEAVVAAVEGSPRRTRWRFTWAGGWSPRPRCATGGATRRPGCGRPRNTFTAPTCRRSPPPAGACCGRPARRSGSAAAARSGCPPRCARWASRSGSTRC